MWANIPVLEAEESLRLYTALVTAGDRAYDEYGHDDILGAWRGLSPLHAPRGPDIHRQFHNLFGWMAARLSGAGHPGIVPVQTVRAPLPGAGR
jgi:hypothetical protein